MAISGHKFRRAGSDGESRGRKIGAAAGHALGSSIRAGVTSYDRVRDLPGLVKLDPFIGPSETAEGVEAIIARLERALRAERNRARSGHWTYDLNRHIALRQAYAAERERLAALQGRERGASARP